MPRYAHCWRPADCRRRIWTTERSFFGLVVNGGLVGAVGLELCGHAALLRSLVVLASHRRHGLGRKLAAQAEQQARQRGCATLYLLTTSARDFFLGLGYAPADRSTAPPEVRATSQFSGLCPSSSAFLVKSLGGSRNPVSDPTILRLDGAE